LMIHYQIIESEIYRYFRAPCHHASTLCGRVVVVPSVAARNAC
jgi:hypothetical protein